MKSETYTPGHAPNAVEFMAQRSLQTHGDFFQAHLTAGVSVLDCGCGPGSITLGIAERVAPGNVTGVDFEASQIERATAAADAANLRNVSFQTADCCCLPFEDSAFGRVFSHALMEHISDPLRALREFHRVLQPGGRVGVCSPDWGGFVLAPPSAEINSAVEAYTRLQSRNGGDVHVGRKLGEYLATAGFRNIEMSARYECYGSLETISEYLAAQLEREGEMPAANTFREWSKTDGGMFAQCWVAAIAQR